MSSDPLSAYRGKRVLVTGATGFIGRHLVSRLIELQAEVVALCHQQPAPWQHPLVGWQACALAQPEAVLSLFQRSQPQVVFHLAGTRGGRGSALAQLSAHLEVNLQITRNLLEASIHHRVESLVTAGSSEEYGSVQAPFREEAGAFPQSSYGVTKLCASLLTRQFARATSLRACSARIFMAYGPGQGLDFFLPQLVHACHTQTPFAMSPGEQTRDFLWIGDCIEALVRVAQAPQMGGQIVNLATGRETSLLQLIELVGKHRALPEIRRGALPYRSEEMMRNVGDPALLESLTGFRPATSLEEGLARLFSESVPIQ